MIKQRWRIAETYSFVSPLVGIINTLLYGIIAIGVTDFVELTLLNVIIFVILVFILFNITGWVFDKTNVFVKDKEKAFETLNVTVFEAQSDYNALKMAYYSKFSKVELSEMLKSHKISKITQEKG